MDGLPDKRPGGGQGAWTYGLVCMSLSVLVVEDDPGIRDDVRILLEDAGYVVHCAVSADEALRILTGIPRPCILLWDAVTPGNDLTMLDHATREGVHVATLPVAIASMRGDTSRTRRPVKTLVSRNAILSVVRELCPASAFGPPG